jgi:hypothetical protein
MKSRASASTARITTTHGAIGIASMASLRRPPEEFSSTMPSTRWATFSQRSEIDSRCSYTAFS